MVNTLLMPDFTIRVIDPVGRKATVGRDIQYYAAMILNMTIGGYDCSRSSKNQLLGLLSANRSEVEIPLYDMLYTMLSSMTSENENSRDLESFSEHPYWTTVLPGDGATRSAVMSGFTEEGREKIALKDLKVAAWLSLPEHV